MDMYPLTIDYNQSVEEMVQAGTYGCANSDITTPNFRIHGKGIVQTVVGLEHFNRPVTLEEAMALFDERGLVAPTIEYLLIFAALYPIIWHNYPVICLGSLWFDREQDWYRAPALRVTEEGSPELDLVAYIYGCSKFCRFLALPKSLAMIHHIQFISSN